jgi:hypothetical protein
MDNQNQSASPGQVIAPNSDEAQQVDPLPPPQAVVINQLEPVGTEPQVITPVVSLQPQIIAPTTSSPVPQIIAPEVDTQLPVNQTQALPIQPIQVPIPIPPPPPIAIQDIQQPNNAIQPKSQTANIHLNINISLPKSPKKLAIIGGIIIVVIVAIGLLIYLA